MKSSAFCILLFHKFSNVFSPVAFIICTVACSYSLLFPKENGFYFFFKHLRKICILIVTHCWKVMGNVLTKQGIMTRRGWSVVSVFIYRGNIYVWPHGSLIWYMQIIQKLTLPSYRRFGPQHVGILKVHWIEVQRSLLWPSIALTSKTWIKS